MIYYKFADMKCAGLVLLIMLMCAWKQNDSVHINSPVQTLTIQFNNVVGNKDLQLDSGIYTNASGEQFSINILQYFISNITLTTVHNKEYIVPQNSSYFLIREEDSTSQFCVINLPAGEYKRISFLVGIDSLRSISKIDKRKGILDPSATDMYWGWNSGYIFFKMEGRSPTAPEDAVGLHKFRYHIGGFGGYRSPTINNIKQIKLSIMPDTLKIKAGANSFIRIKADIGKVFDDQASISIATNPAIMFDDYSSTIANNYASMFSIDAIKN